MVGRSAYICGSGRLAVQLFEMREQAAEVIKDFSRGRLAVECGATEEREAKQQLKKKRKKEEAQWEHPA